MNGLGDGVVAEAQIIREDEDDRGRPGSEGASSEAREGSGSGGHCEQAAVVS